jgi:hypothetical protein
MDVSRHQEYKLYWHFQEFNPVDLEDNLDIDEKYKKRQKIEQVLEKFRSLPEATHISKFLKFEKLNLKTQLYNKTNKLDSILKQLNADPTLQL